MCNFLTSFELRHALSIIKLIKLLIENLKHVPLKMILKFAVNYDLLKFCKILIKYFCIKFIIKSNIVRKNFTEEREFLLHL